MDELKIILKPTITDCDFKNIYETIIVINDGFTHLRQKKSTCLREYKRINLTNILRWLLFLLILDLKHSPENKKGCLPLGSHLPSTPSVRFSMVHVEV